MFPPKVFAAGSDFAGHKNGQALCVCLYFLLGDNCDSRREKVQRKQCAIKSGSVCVIAGACL